MNKLIIINYIKKLTKNDIYRYCVNNNIPINEEEVDVIYYYIKIGIMIFLKEEI